MLMDGAESRRRRLSLTDPRFPSRSSEQGRQEEEEAEEERTEEAAAQAARVAGRGFGAQRGRGLELAQLALGRRELVRQRQRQRPRRGRGRLFLRQRGGGGEQLQARRLPPRQGARWLQ